VKEKRKFFEKKRNKKIKNDLIIKEKKGGN
jgi:hypothetical protein